MTEEAPKYGPTDLLGDAGAVLGLFFGASALGAFDLAAEAALVWKRQTNAVSGQ